MSSYSYLSIEKQQGVFSLDEIGEKSCYDEIREECNELLEDSERDRYCPMFKVINGELKICGGSENDYEYGTTLNTWSYSGLDLLKCLAKYLKGNGQILFSDIREGGFNNFYLLKNGKVSDVVDILFETYHES